MPTTLPPSTRIIVMDEVTRHPELYGNAFALLGITPECGHGRLFDDILAQRPSAIILSREWSYEWRLAAAAARRASIPVIYVMDGVIEWSYVWNNLSYVRGEGTVLQPLFASDLCVIGQHPARILAALGLAPRIHVTGLTRYDTFDRSRVLRHGTRPRIVIATARTYAHNAEQEVLTRRALRDLKAWFATQPSLEPVWRIAPSLAAEFELPAATSGTLAEHLAEAAACLSFPSTCVLEAMLKGIPVAQIDYRPIPAYVTTAWEIRSPEHIPSVVQELLYPPPHRLAYQDACLRDELEPSPASERLADVIRQAVLNPSPYAKANSSAPAPALSSSTIHGRLDYHQVHSELSAFALSDSSLLQYELDAALGLLKHLRKNPAASGPDSDYIRDLERVSRERLETIQSLDRLATERLETIQSLDRLATERQQTIEQLSGFSSSGLSPAPLPPPPPTPADLDAQGETLWSAGRQTEALDAFTRAASLQPDEPERWIKLGLSYRLLENLPASSEALERAVRLAPDHYRAIHELGVTRMLQADFRGAGELFILLQTRDPADLQPILLCARCHFELGELTDARREYQRALDLDPANEDARENLVFIENTLAEATLNPTERALRAAHQAPAFKPTPEMLAREYPCPYAFTQLYVVPRGHLDIRFCSYHGPVNFSEQDKIYEQGLPALEALLHGHPELVARRAHYLAGDYKAAGCSENCIWLNRWKVSHQGFKLADHLSPEGRFRLGKMWLSMGPDCNVRCRYCLDTDDYKMDFNSCDPRVMDLARDFVRAGGELLLTGGETFLPKWGFARALEQLVAWGDAKGTIALHSNGTYLNEKNRDLLLRGPVNTIGISMDTLRKDLYEYLRRGTDYDLVWGNVTSLLAERTRRAQFHPRITILCAVMKSTADHVLETVERVVAAGLGISLNALFQAYYSPEFSAREGLHNLDSDALHRLYEDVLTMERRYGPNGPVNYQGFKGQVENQLALLRSGTGERQVQLGGGGHTPALPHVIHLDLAEQYLAAGRFTEAEAALAPILSKIKRSSRGQRLLARTLDGLGRTEPALAAWRQAVRLDPRDPAALAATTASPVLAAADDDASAHHTDADADAPLAETSAA